MEYSPSQNEWRGYIILREETVKWRDGLWTLILYKFRGYSMVIHYENYDYKGISVVNVHNANLIIEQTECGCDRNGRKDK